MRWFLALAVLLTVVGCGGDDDDSGAKVATQDQVKEAATTIVTSALAADWGAVYDHLHPAQQAIVTKDAFVACRSQLTTPAYTATATQVGHDAMTAPEIYDTSSWAVTFDLALEGYETIARTLHMYDTDGTLAWYMDQVSIDAFRSGNCDIDPRLAGEFALSIANAEIAGDWATVYDGLHPNQQAVVPKDLFLECRASDSVQATSASINGVTTEAFAAPYVPLADSYAVTLKGLNPDQTESFGTLHIFDIGETFAWVLGAESIAAFEAGQCD